MSEPPFPDTKSPTFALEIEVWNAYCKEIQHKRVNRILHIAYFLLVLNFIMYYILFYLAFIKP